ncbi:hypothetical protein, conserved [Plasmodium gonderi]|uniref:CPW-WPC domain-containing protein n=1 Tax=Plasmodium gonderi TaxID=77519 RepID=A0A1Y1JSE2_PLAGO|nr:hypothetical protein, conserved [Plasmodium gonderi]GAW83722.1 hypothetical protein, conserved [Plasmodium gonderi]
MLGTKVLVAIFFIGTFPTHELRFSSPFAHGQYVNKRKPEGRHNLIGETNEFNNMSYFSQDLTQLLSHSLKSVPILALREKVKAQVEKAALSLQLPNPEEETCEMNYSELCPEGWGNWGDGENCISPMDYRGPCKKEMISFKNSTPREKYNFSIKCKVSWPCVYKCSEEDFSGKCPENWILENGTCYAPRNYIGKCVRQKNFQNFSETEKKIWADACDVNWPCYKKNYNFEILCPQNWIQHPDNKNCLAPNSYIGPCGGVLYLYNLKDEEKKLLMNKCNIEWPIRSSVEEHDLNEYACPVGWKMNISHQKEMGTCTMPDSYDGPCVKNEEIKNISFENFSKEEKYEISQKCNIMWHFTDEKYQNFDLPCPFNWVLVDAVEHICIAPVEYTEPCNNIFSFKNYTNQMKAAWAFRCKVIFMDNINDNHVMMNTTKKRKIFGLDRERNNNTEDITPLTDTPSVSDGPIGHVGSMYEGVVLNALNNVEYLPQNKSSLRLSRGHINVTDIGNMNTNEFILSDEKITDLLLLKQLSNDDELKRNIDEVIRTLRRNEHVEKNFFSFIQVRSKASIRRSTNETSGVGKSTTDMEEAGTPGTLNLEKDWDREKKSRNEDGMNEHNLIISEQLTDEKNLNEIKNLYTNYQIEGTADQSYYEHICFEKNYTECPIGWIKISAKECMAPSSYRKNVERCSTILNLNDLTKSVYSVTHDMSFVTMDEEKIKNFEKKCNVQFPCIDCERDYVQVNCPLGWTQKNDESCESPEDYPMHLKGVCGTNVNFKYATPSIRRNWSYLCKSDWPCFSQCEKNYSSICPLGYKLINERSGSIYGDGIIYICVNHNWVEEHQLGERTNGTTTATELGKRNECLVIEIYNSVQVKKEIERKCKVIWPCLNKCEQDYYQTCPYNWLLKNNSCISPYYYKPPRGCHKSFSVKSFSTFDKYLFSNKCFAPWPCKNACQQDWSQPCPEQWLLVKRKKNIPYKKKRNSHAVFCKPPPLYNGNDSDSGNDNDSDSGNDNDSDNGNDNDSDNGNDNDSDNGNDNGKRTGKGKCREELYDLTDFTFLQKQEFSHECSVRWPCGRSSLNYSPNWQTEKVYHDVNFGRLKTLRFYNSHYASQYAQRIGSFF